MHLFFLCLASTIWAASCQRNSLRTFSKPFWSGSTGATTSRPWSSPMMAPTPSCFAARTRSSLSASSSPARRRHHTRQSPTPRQTARLRHSSQARRSAVRFFIFLPIRPILIASIGSCTVPVLLLACGRAISGTESRRALVYSDSGLYTGTVQHSTSTRWVSLCTARQ